MDRPTFSEHWSRVADTAPRLRASVQSHAQRFRGERWHVLRDPATNHFFRLSPPAYRFVALLDGRRSVAQAWRLASEADGNEAPTQPESIQLLAQLHSNNLLHADLPGDTRSLLERHARRRRRERLGRAASFLFVRLPLIDPDRLLDRVSPTLGLAFTLPAFVAVLGLVGLGLGAIVSNDARFLEAIAGAFSPEALPFLYAAFVVSKLVHELAHGVSTKWFARREGVRAEVHTAGIMLLVLIPYPFVDASAAWSLRSKWRRAAIGAAGMYAELALASAAALVWANTAPGTVNALALQTILVASVATILFNANPLLRYDGYYILSDLTETPNLAQRARERLHELVKRRLWGVRGARRPARSGAEAGLLTLYALAAGPYRVLVGVVIVLAVSRMFFVVGVALAIAAAAMFFLVPVGKLVRYLAASHELDFHRRRAIATTAGILAAAVVLVGLIPAPRWVTLTGVVEPARRADVFVLEAGFIESAPTRPVEVGAGAPIIEAANPTLDAELAVATALAEGARLRLVRATVDDPAGARVRQQELGVYESRVDDLRRRRASLSLGATFPGTFVPAASRAPLGRYLERGERLGSLMSVDDVRVRAMIPQSVAGALIADPPETVRVRPHADPTRVLTAPFVPPLPAATRRQSLAERRFQLVIPIAEPGPLRPGQRVRVRAILPSEPIYTQARRAVLRLLQDERAG